jgi:lipoyl(octanoyl) transferase
MPKISVHDLGRMDYQTAWDYQESLLQQNVAVKSLQRAGESVSTTNHLLFVEHPHVYTLGKSGRDENILITEEDMASKKISFFRTNRGGDITYHGPGAVVGYPIIDLEQFKTDIGYYLRGLEEVIIRTIGHYGLKGERSKGETGVWLDVAANPRKICAMGIRCSRWVTMHGFSLNANTDLEFFKHIVPCGITDKSVTSIQAEIGAPVDLNELKLLITQHFGDVFGAEMLQENLRLAVDVKNLSE